MVEPDYFVPVIPSILINGADGIGTHFVFFLLSLFLNLSMGK